MSEITKDRTMKHYYYIGKEFFIASINADTSGLNEEDIKHLERFEQNLINEYGHACFLYENNNTEWRRCEISKLHNDCIEVYMTPNKG